jgi:hypothetical protein
MQPASARLWPEGCGLCPLSGILLMLDGAAVCLQGCGLITYKDRTSAAAAIQQLHGEYTFPGSDCPMVVEWMDLKKQRPAGNGCISTQPMPDAVLM